jgi:hypothetical protein
MLVPATVLKGKWPGRLTLTDPLLSSAVMARIFHRQKYLPINVALLTAMIKA